MTNEVVSSSVSASRGNGERVRTLVRENQQTIVTLTVLVAVMLTFTLTSDRFMMLSNMQNVSRTVSATIISACAVTLVMIARGLDLSVGSVLAVSAVLAADLASSGMNLWLAYFLAILLAAAFGALNGAIIVFLHVSPIIVTLGTLNVARGVAYLISPSAIIVGLPPNWSFLGTTPIGPVPLPFLIALACCVMFWFLLNRTVFGRNIYAIGGNEQAALLSGIRVRSTTFVLYLLSGIMAGLAGLVLSSRIGSGDPNIGIGFEFVVIVAVILGGTSLAGGEGRIAGTILGALIVGFLANWLNLIGVASFWQFVATGTALILAVVIDRLARTRAETLEVRATK